MTKKVISTKRALITSVLSLLLCMSMLLGTTFAWFTDEVSSARNIIVSGELDVELYFAKTADDVANDNWTKVTETTKVFDDTALWEPGYTEVAYFKVVNEGTLALKYKMSADIIKEKLGKNKAGNEFKLSESLMYGAVPADNIVELTTRVAAVEKAVTEMTDSNDISGVLEDLGLGSGWDQFIGAVETSATLLPDESKVSAIVITMPTSVGNEANHNGTDIPEIQLGINLYAAQQMHESDSFDNKYDEKAEYMAVASSAEELASAIEQGGEVKIVSDLTIKNQEIAANTTTSVDLGGNDLTAPLQDNGSGKLENVFVNNGVLTLSGSGTITTRNTMNNPGATLTIEDGVTIIANSPGAGSAIWNQGNVTINGATIKQQNDTNYAVNSVSSDPTTTVVVNGGDITSNHGAFYMAGGTGIINDGNFTIEGRGSSHVIYVGGDTNLTINGGTFTHNGIGGDGTVLGAFGNAVITVNGGTFNANGQGYGPSTSSNGKLYINGGTFNTTSLHAWAGSDSIVITGGTFASDPSKYVKDGYVATENNGTWTVAAE